MLHNHSSNDVMVGWCVLVVVPRVGDVVYGRRDVQEERMGLKYLEDDRMGQRDTEEEQIV